MLPRGGVWQGPQKYQNKHATPPDIRASGLPPPLPSLTLTPPKKKHTRDVEKNDNSIADADPATGTLNSTDDIGGNVTHVEEQSKQDRLQPCLTTPTEPYSVAGNNCRVGDGGVGAAVDANAAAFAQAIAPLNVKIVDWRGKKQRKSGSAG